MEVALKKETRISNEWKFPASINFETATYYINKLSQLDYENDIIFDLSETSFVHSSFIGFLLDTKNRSSNNGGKLILKLSPTLERLIVDIDLYDHFLSNAS